MYQNRQALAFGSILFLIIVSVILVVLSLWVWPRYNLYRMEMHGMAALKEAEGNAQVVRAKAEGLADIERAKAAAESNRIIGESLKGNDEYLRYIWIKGLQDGKGERIYIPTEAGLPILEAGKAR